MRNEKVGLFVEHLTADAMALGLTINEVMTAFAHVASRMGQKLDATPGRKVTVDLHVSDAMNKAAVKKAVEVGIRGKAMGPKQQARRANWDARGFSEEYLGGYRKSTVFDQYAVDSAAREAWRVGHEDWLQDVENRNSANASMDDLTREFFVDFGEFLDVGVGAATWVNRNGQFFSEADVKICGEIWRVHKSDADPYPSNPHAHCVGGSRFTGCTLHLGTRELFRKREPLGRLLDREQFERLLERIRPKFPGIKFPLPA